MCTQKSTFDFVLSGFKKTFFSRYVDILYLIHENRRVFDVLYYWCVSMLGKASYILKPFWLPKLRTFDEQ